MASKKLTKLISSEVTIAMVFLLGLLLAVLIYFSNQPLRQEPAIDLSKIDESMSCDGLEIKKECLKLERAETNQARLKGLSDRDGLPDKSGMLFIFESPDEQCFWMKDMRFSLDIVWANEAKQIIKIEENVSPDSYPKNFCAPDTKYVLEFGTGFVDEYGLKTGTTLQF